ncbi:serine/threonine-protein kinase [Archangium sp.]|uniref:serine/threonine protein kinase n=1 Tax=Archangium sp. TaxID=1872627 RepID=UPI002D7039E8|nr:serine/threonine-protein kinase [Archangium sp.]HYO55201.1 serine/threonine-protein kinase [Archangium sp.]
MFNLERFTRMSRRPPARRVTGPILFSREGTDFERIQRVGEGPHGEAVLLARRHPPRGQPELVVVKTLGSHQPSKARQRLEEEAKLASRLSHPGIAQVLGHYQQGDTSYTVLELVAGASLATVLCDATLCGRPLSEELGLYVCAEVAGALHYAHTLADEHGQPLGIVHRNVCPSNIRLAHGGQVKLTSLGGAWSRLPGREETTEDGGPLGDADYAAPERLGGAGVGTGANLFSLGLVLLEMVTGQHLYHVAPLERRVAHVRSLWEGASWRGGGEPLPVEELELRADCFGPRDVEYAARGLSAPVKAILHGLLRREPSERYATGEELRADLRRCLKARSWWYGPRRAARELARLRAEAAPLRRTADAVATFLGSEGLDMISRE